MIDTHTHTHLSSSHGHHLTGSTSDNTRHHNVSISRTATVENLYNLVPWLELVQNGGLAADSQLLCWQADKKSAHWRLVASWYYLTVITRPDGQVIEIQPSPGLPLLKFIGLVYIDGRQKTPDMFHRFQFIGEADSFKSNLKSGDNSVWTDLSLHSYICALGGGREHALKWGFDLHHYAFCFNMTEKMSGVYLWVSGIEGSILLDIWRVTPWK